MRRRAQAAALVEPWAEPAPAFAPPSVAEWSAWPVSGAYGPHPAAFRISGQGLLYFCRKGAEGDFAFVLAIVDFFRSGLSAVGLTDRISEEEFKRDFMDRLPGKGGYDVRAAAPETVSRLFWGTFGFQEEQGYRLPDQQLAALKAFIRPPAGEPQRWLRSLTATGLLEKGLLKAARRNQCPADFPDDKELAVFTLARFRAPDAEALEGGLRRAEPELTFIEESERGLEFSWTRKYPRRHWSPLARLGGRQSLGDVTVSGNEVSVETKTTSWAGRFAQLLDEKVGPGVELLSVTYRDVNALAREAGTGKRR